MSDQNLPKSDKDKEELLAELDSDELQFEVFQVYSKSTKAHGIHSHLKFQVIYCSQGSHLLKSKNQDLICTPGRILLIPPGLSHEAVYSGKSHSILLYLADDLIPFEVHKEKASVYAASPLAREIFIRLGQNKRNSTLDDKTRRLLSVLWDELTPLGSHTDLPQLRDPRLIKLIDYIQSHLDEAISIEEAAKIAGASSRNLNRILTRELGISIGKLRSQIRLMRAIELLESRTSMLNIALELGFSSQSAFTRFFSKETGFSPSYYSSHSKGTVPLLEKCHPPRYAKIEKKELPFWRNMNMKQMNLFAIALLLFFVSCGNRYPMSSCLNCSQARLFNIDEAKPAIQMEIYGQAMTTPDEKPFLALITKHKESKTFDNFKEIAFGFEGGGTYCVNISDGQKRKIFLNELENFSTNLEETDYKVTSKAVCP